jgi:hypothetical protein
MAIRGRKPTLPHLRLVTGNPGKRRLRGADPSGDSFGGREKPKALPAAVSRIWDMTIARAHWLEWPDSDKAAVWCFLQAEFYAAKGKMLSSRIAQLRVLGAELGLDPTSPLR